MWSKSSRRNGQRSLLFAMKMPSAVCTPSSSRRTHYITISSKPSRKRVAGVNGGNGADQLNNKGTKTQREPRRVIGDPLNRPTDSTETPQLNLNNHGWTPINTDVNAVRNIHPVGEVAHRRDALCLSVSIGVHPWLNCGF